MLVTRVRWFIGRLAEAPCALAVIGVCLLGSSRSLADAFTFDLMTPGHLIFPSWMPERPLASAPVASPNRR